MQLYSEQLQRTMELRGRTARSELQQSRDYKEQNTINPKEEKETLTI